MRLDLREMQLWFRKQEAHAPKAQKLNMLIPSLQDHSGITRCTLLIVVLALSCILPGCQQSDPDSAPGLLLTLQLPGDDMERMESVIGRGDGGFVRRCVIEVVKSESGELIQKRSVVPEIDHDGYFNIGFDLPDGDYDFKIWSDYVHADSPETDLCYTTDDLDEVEVCQPRPEVPVGFRDAAYGFIENVSCTPAPDRVELKLQRAVGRYTILGEKVCDYILLWEDSPDRFPPVETLRLEITHNSYTPTSFSVTEGQVKNSAPDVSYICDPSQMPNGGVTADDELTMADEMVFVGEISVSIVLTIDVWGPDGLYVGYIRGLPVEIHRDCQTIIRGDFLVLGAPRAPMIIDRTWAEDIIIHF